MYRHAGACLKLITGTSTGNIISHFMLQFYLHRKQASFFFLCKLYDLMQWPLKSHWHQFLGSLARECSWGCVWCFHVGSICVLWDRKQVIWNRRMLGYLCTTIGVAIWWMLVGKNKGTVILLNFWCTLLPASWKKREILWDQPLGVRRGLKLRFNCAHFCRWYETEECLVVFAQR